MLRGSMRNDRNHRMQVAFSGMIALLCIGVRAQAAPILNNFGLSSPANALDFEGFNSDGIPVENQFQPDGVVFTGTQNGPLVTLSSDPFAGMDGIALNQGGDAFQIQFIGTVSEAAFAFLTNPGTSTFNALLEGTVVESISSSTSFSFDPSDATYFGFSGIVFDAIEVEPGGTNGAFRLDNLQYGEVTTAAVPEPSTLCLLTLGVAGLLWRRRWR